MMRRSRLWAAAVAVSAAVAGAAVGTAAMGDDGGHDSHDSHDARQGKTVFAELSGYEEDPLTISTPGTGRFVAHIDEKRQEISYRLSYENLESAVQQAHIHFGGRHQSGGIVAFLCTNLGNGPAGTQTCPPAPATITGTITPADVVTAPNQGIDAGEFDELVDAIEAGVTYANVHTAVRTGGEIRGQINSDDDD
ncbi:CHRD domain-containing protein [Micromonospora rhizosphaerae]|uniref:CHRD domain-containing protein n=1 Tax=Micromonospora rhizosphaerae TaxID=568872 RepID=A0A1C6RSR7_9ACTN|nr:CHRD domain-containing protein [Micromonospora rhizosphaerae]SCL20092.1 CHRD domain-containing protein [Micromonospora rhizosphaerae]